MNTTTILNPITTHNAGVPPAPSEAHPRAGGKPDFTAILREALTSPGTVNQAYRLFWRFSIGNQMLAAVQLLGRGLKLAPIASFSSWRDKGRFVRKGEKAICLYMPVTMKRRGKEHGDGEDESFSCFLLRPNWFSLDQTDGTPFPVEVVAPDWDAARALSALGVEEEGFAMLTGNCMGYARARVIAINPLNPLKHKTRFHELAHVVLGHTEASAGMIVDGVTLRRDLQEVEAESVAYILCTLLDLPGQAESRSYIQAWLDGQALPDKSAKRIFRAADAIMKAGQSTPAAE